MNRFLFAAGLAIAALPTTFANAQLNMGALQNAHSSANAARHLPTFLGDNFNRFQINVLNPYVMVGSNFASYQDARELLRADQLSSRLIGNTLNNLKAADNNIHGSLDLSIVNAAFNLRGRDGSRFLTVGAGVNERVELSSGFNRELLELAAYGNKRFAGQTIDILPRFKGMAFMEWYLAGSLNLKLPNTGFSIQPAVRLSYLSGQAGISMKKDNYLRMFTQEEGRYLDFNLDYRIDAALGSDSLRLEGSSFNLNDKSLSGGSGSGFGMDLAVRVVPMAGLSINVGLMDIGSIRFRKGVTNMYNTSTYRYEGTDIDFQGNSSLNLDSVASLAKPNYSNEAFSMTLPTKLVISGSYGIQPHSSKSDTWYTHQLTFLYLQGFSNYLSSTTRPLMSIGYTYSLANMLNLGVNAGVGGVYGGSIGALASVKVGALRIGITSNNILSLLAPSSGRGADGGLLLGLAF